MKRVVLFPLIIIFVFSLNGFAQVKPDNSKIDIMLIRGEFNKVIDTCNQILASDTLNPEIYYDKGLAFQSLMSEDQAFGCFLKASTLSPSNNNYSFTLAKAYFARGKNNKAKPILQKLCSADSTNWAYAFYLTSIYMQEKKYDESIDICKRFYKHDSLNYVLTDKIGFACLKKGDSKQGIEMFNKSLALNPRDLNAIKNVAYLYAGSVGADTAVQILSNGIEIDSTDLDIYARRAALLFTVHNYRESAADYVKIVNSGDSSFFNLKRAGICLGQINESEKAVKYLTAAHKSDTSDLEVLTFLARHYANLGNLKQSEFYYRCIGRDLEPFIYQAGLNHILLAETLKKEKQYSGAISEYIKSQVYRSDKNIYLTVANLYDEKLKDYPKAIYYYELFLRRTKSTSDEFDARYNESITRRIESLKKILNTSNPH